MGQRDAHARLEGENTGLPGLTEGHYYYCGELMYGVVWERETHRQTDRHGQNDRMLVPFPVDRGTSEEVKAVRSRLRWWLDCHPWPW